MIKQTMEEQQPDFNELKLGDISLSSSQLDLDKLIKKAKKLLEDEVFQKYLGFYKIKKIGGMLG